MFSNVFVWGSGRIGGGLRQNRRPSLRAASAADSSETLAGKTFFDLAVSRELRHITEWSSVEWSALEWSRGHGLRGAETLLEPVFRNLRANFVVKQMEFELCREEAGTALWVSFGTLQKRRRTMGF